MGAQRAWAAHRSWCQTGPSHRTCTPARRCRGTPCRAGRPSARPPARPDLHLQTGKPPLASCSQCSCAKQQQYRGTRVTFQCPSRPKGPHSHVQNRQPDSQSCCQCQGQCFVAHQLAHTGGLHAGLIGLVEAGHLICGQLLVWLCWCVRSVDPNTWCSDSPATCGIGPSVCSSSTAYWCSAAGHTFQQLLASGGQAPKSNSAVSCRP